MHSGAASTGDREMCCPLEVPQKHLFSGCNGAATTVACIACPGGGRGREAAKFEAGGLQAQRSCLLEAVTKDRVVCGSPELPQKRVVAE